MTIGNNAAPRLRSFVERIERLNVDAEAIKTDTKEVFAEAKGDGFDVKIIRKVIRLRKQDKAKRSEEASLVDLYMSVLEGPGWDDGPRAPPSDPRSSDPRPRDPSEEREGEAPDEAEGAAEASEHTPAEAAAAGRQAAQDGVAVTANPYPAGSQQRVAWDMAWCAATGTDGMDIPEDLKPKGDRK